MTEVQRIFALMTATERDLYRQLGGVIPPFTPLSDPEWSVVPRYPGSMKPDEDRRLPGEYRKTRQDTSRYAVVWNGRRFENVRLAGELLGVSERTLRDMAYRGRELRGHPVEMVLKKKTRKAA